MAVAQGPDRGLLRTAGSPTCRLRPAWHLLRAQARAGRVNEKVTGRFRECPRRVGGGGGDHGGHAIRQAALHNNILCDILVSASVNTRYRVCLCVLRTCRALTRTHTRTHTGADDHARGVA